MPRWRPRRWIVAGKSLPLASKVQVPSCGGWKRYQTPRLVPSKPRFPTPHGVSLAPVPLA
jgi:hypothetical protein